MDEQRKYQILMQGMTSNNVAHTCKEHNISRTIYYRWYKAYLLHGMNGLTEKGRRNPNMPNKVDKQTEKKILAYVAKYPSDGPKRIYYELQEEGLEVSESGIYNVLRRNQLNKRAQREAYAQVIRKKKRHVEHLTADSFIKDDRKAIVSYKKVLDYNMNQSKHAYPGYICQQSINYLGNYPKIGRVYQYVMYDAYSRVGLVKLYSRKSTIHIMEFMYTKIIPLMRTFNFKIDHLVTNKSQEFTTSWERGSHKYNQFLRQYQIQQVTITAAEQDIFKPLNSFLSVMNKEFYQQVWHDPRIDSFEALEKRLAAYLKSYNFHRTITDGPNKGKVPSDVVLDYFGPKEVLPLWLHTRRV